ncbi:MAG: glutamyl-tRNA ligase [Rickettsiales bacterium]|jgi:glutamyl-tRNA synthetase|nr:glutamyl-tRNA ligase [Rickettsiales bacterium]
MTVISRFAPSPTGYLHVGNVRTALVNWLYTRSKNGKFLLRLDDTDKERSKEEYVEGIKRDLAWLGLTYDGVERQSDRFPRYKEVVDQLTKEGRFYPCYETQEELEIKRKMLLSRGLPPIYDRAALKLTDAQKAQFEKEGRKAHWRFKLAPTPMQWQDEVRGEIRFEAENLSDPILIREDGTPTYMLPSAVDDFDMGITHVVRGEDHITNTAIQIQIFEALGNHMPSFAHLSLIKSKDEKISKREGGFDIATLREEGIEAMSIASFFAKLGTSDPIEVKESLEQLIAEFDIKRFSKAQALYDKEELVRLNSKLVHQMPFASAKERLKAMGLTHVDEAFWDSVRPNLQTLAEIKDWWNICKEAITPAIEDAEFARQAAGLLPEGNWDSTTWHEWVEKVKGSTGRKGKQLFMPLRKALTARESGPELAAILPLIGRERAVRRLHGEAA